MPARWRWRPCCSTWRSPGAWSRYLPTAPRRARSPQGAISAWRAPPRPAPPRPLAASSSSKFSPGRPGCPPAGFLCFSESRARAAKCVQEDPAQHSRDSRPYRPAAAVWVLPRANCPRELSLWLLSGQRLRLRGRGVSRKLLSPPYSSPPACPPLILPLLCTCTPPLGRSPSALLPSPKGGPTTDQYNPLSLPPPFPLTQRNRNESSASVVAVRWNRLWHHQRLSEPGFLEGSHTDPGSPRAPQRPKAVITTTPRSPMHKQLNCSLRAHKQACTKPTDARRDRFLLSGLTRDLCGGGRQHRTTKRW